MKQIFDFLSSLKLAVFVLVSLAISLASATFVESAYGTPTARHFFYQAWWFQGILMLLAVNVLCAALSRWPWQPRHYGFVVTHAGIIVLLTGALVTSWFGCEGQLMLDTGEKSSLFELNQPVLTVFSQKLNQTAEFSVADLKFRAPSDDKPMRLQVPNGPRLAIHGYYDSSLRKTGFTGGLPGDPPAVHFGIANARVKQEQWLGGNSDETRMTQLGLASFAIASAPDQATLKALLAPPQADAYQGELVLNFPGTSASFPIAGNVGKTLDIPKTQNQLRITRFLANAVVASDKTGQKRLISKGNDPSDPAVEFDILTPSGPESHTLLARLPDVAGVVNDQHSGVVPQFVFDPQQVGQDNLGNRLLFVAGPDGKLWANLHARDGRNQVAELKPDQPFDTGWMGLQVTVKAFLPHAIESDEVAEAEVPANGREGPPAGAHLFVENGGSSKDFWIRQGEQFNLNIGGDNLVITFGRKEKDLGFAMTLDKFAVGHDPGTQNPSTYTSNVTVDDPAAGRVNEKDVITMNQPLHHRGWTLFQSSFSQVDGHAPTSIFTVAYDPGVPIKYAGSLIMCLGIGLMFWLRGWYQGLGKKSRKGVKPRDNDRSGKASLPVPAEPEAALQEVGR
ncbi:MAG TPA: cytochrome c biogenesis protein ResB [Candidatus Xenobia bacterium]|jgi:hypothetical protein